LRDRFVEIAASAQALVRNLSSSKFRSVDNARISNCEVTILKCGRMSNRLHVVRLYARIYLRFFLRCRLIWGAIAPDDVIRIIFRSAYITRADLPRRGCTEEQNRPSITFSNLVGGCSIADFKLLASSSDLPVQTMLIRPRRPARFAYPGSCNSSACCAVPVLRWPDWLPLVNCSRSGS
jgi:hypothetical protein